jgi:hypothetical protein
VHKATVNTFIRFSFHHKHNVSDRKGPVIGGVAINKKAGREAHPADISDLKFQV